MQIWWRNAYQHRPSWSTGMRWWDKSTSTGTSKQKTTWKNEWRSLLRRSPLWRSTVWRSTAWRSIEKKKENKQKYEIINIKEKDRVWLWKPSVTAVRNNPLCICRGGRNIHGKHRCQLWYTEHYLEQYFFWKHKMKPSRCLMFDAIKAFWTNCQCHCDQNAKQRKKNVDTKRKKQLKEKTYEVFNYLPLIPWRMVKNVTTQRQPQWSYTIETVPKAPNSRTAEATSMVTQLQRYSTTVKLSGTTHRPQYGD